MMISFSRVALRRFPTTAVVARCHRTFSTTVETPPIDTQTDSTAAFAVTEEVVEAPPVVDFETLLSETYSNLRQSNDDFTYTPGHILAVLNTIGKGGVELHERDFRHLLQTARPYEQKDATVLLTAMVNYKRINRFLLTEELAADCVDSILTTSDPTTGGLLLMEHFYPASGLYYAMSLDDVHKMLRHVLDNAIDSPDVTPERIWTALVSCWEQLMERHSLPHREMKKRAKRRYLKQLQINARFSGPTQETVELAVEIGLSLKSDEAQDVYDTLVKPCLESPRRIDLDSIGDEDSILHALNAKRMAQQHATADGMDDLAMVWSRCIGIRKVIHISRYSIVITSWLTLVAITQLTQYKWCQNMNTKQEVRFI